MSSINPALVKWDGPLGLPRFAAIGDDDFAPAFAASMAEHDAEIAAIADCAEPATFDNTICALERAGEALSRVSALFANKAGTDLSDAIQVIQRQVAPQLARHHSRIAMNAALFARVDTLHRTRTKLGLDAEARRVLEKHWRSFVRAGAALSAADQARIGVIEEELALLGARFGQNVLNDEKAWSLVLETEADLAGLPDSLRDAMAAAAAERGRPGAHAVTLSRSIVEPFLTFSDRRDLREAAFGAWTARGETDGATDNRAMIAEILALRDEKARLLGHADYAAFKLEETMAKTPEAVTTLLGTVWEKAVARAGEEEAALSRLVAEAGHNHAVAPWDWRYYAEKLRAGRFDFTEQDVKPYLQLDRIFAACFDVAGRLFGIRLAERTDVAGYHPDVRVFEVFDARDTRIGVFMADCFARSTKRSGAWMNAFQRQHKLAHGDGRKGQEPVVYTVMNFARPPAGKPALLSLSDARTLFHEFGHALHGLLSNVTYPSLSGTSVARDFVELPSQLYEHWLTTPEILRTYAVHERTGEAMPQALIDKVLAARTANAGFETVEYTASALVDMACHTDAARAASDPAAFEAATLERLGMPRSIVMRHRLPHFLHVFAGSGYAAGYYSYMWSQVLDADAFEAFAATGNVFDAETAGRLKTHIYAAGDAVDPAETYAAFRARLPAPEAMMRQIGLVD